MPESKLSTQLIHLYNDYRTALMNEKYYGYRLSQTRKQNLAVEVAQAAGASSAIASWAIWQSGPAAVLWAGITAVTAVVAIAKPLLNFGAKIETSTMLFTRHEDAFYDLQEIVRAVETQQAFPRALHTAYQRTIDRLRNLAQVEEPTPDTKLLEKCQDEVNVEIPPHLLWMPKGAQAHGEKTKTSDRPTSA